MFRGPTVTETVTDYGTRFRSVLIEADRPVSVSLWINWVLAFLSFNLSRWSAQCPPCFQKERENEKPVDGCHHEVNGCDTSCGPKESFGHVLSTSDLAELRPAPNFKAPVFWLRRQPRHWCRGGIWQLCDLARNFWVTQLNFELMFEISHPTWKERVLNWETFWLVLRRWRLWDWHARRAWRFSSMVGVRNLVQVVSFMATGLAISNKGSAIAQWALCRKGDSVWTSWLWWLRPHSRWRRIPARLRWWRPWLECKAAAARPPHDNFRFGALYSRLQKLWQELACWDRLAILLLTLVHLRIHEPKMFEANKQPFNLIVFVWFSRMLQKPWPLLKLVVVCQTL